MMQLKMGNVYDWKTISTTYPDMYAIITDVKKKNGEILRCRLLEVVPFEKEEETVCKYMDLGIKFECERTTFKMPNMGVLF